MTRTALFTLPLLALGCTPGGSYQGRLVDGMTGQPRTGFKVLAKAMAIPDMACQVREVDVGPDGSFSFAETCAGEYTITLMDETLFMEGPTTFQGGETPAAPVEAKVWRAPSGAGVFKLSGDALATIRSYSDVETATVWGSDATVRYPTTKPLRLAGSQMLAPGDHLVLSGKSNVERLMVHPLIDDTGKRRFKGAAEGAWVDIPEHTFIGARFDAAGALTVESASFDAAKVTSVGSGDRVLRYIAADALPQGRYALLADNDKRTFILDFGTAPPAAE